MVVGDGKIGRIYLETSAKVPVDIKLPSETNLQYLPSHTVRRGERGFIACLEQNCSDKSLVKGDIILTDAENAFKTDFVVAYLDDKGIYSDHFPPGLGHLMNPCDQYYHASVKARYWRYIDEYRGKVTMEDMVSCIHKAVFKEKGASIRNYFKSCGIVGSDKTPEEVMNHLIYEGLSPSKKYKSMHLKQLKSFIEWKWANHYNIMRKMCKKYRKIYEEYNI